jgi:hypothetical protein
MTQHADQRRPDPPAAAMANGLRTFSTLPSAERIAVLDAAEQLLDAECQ